MPSKPLILSIDQGTSSSRAFIFNSTGEILASAQKQFKQYYPADGWVEHDPEEIWSSVLSTCKQAIEDTRRLGTLCAIGITNQRETTLIWDRISGEPISNAIVWQDRRTAAYCQELKEQDMEKEIISKTGLLLDPYFSATKITWILDNISGARQRAESGELAFGTIDTFLIWRLTAGKSHYTDATNASRTLLYNIHNGQWDKDLLDIFNVPLNLLPEVKNSADDFGTTANQVLGMDLPIAGVAGDQQAALIGQGCFEPGMTKSTYGTGCFMVLNTGDKAVFSNNRLLTTIAYRIDHKTCYALEGSIFNAGTTIQWLKDSIGIINSASEIESSLEQTDSNNGTYLVPAFTGLGAPYWQPEARGILSGMTRDTGRLDLIRAAIECVCYQTNDLAKAMIKDIDGNGAGDRVLSEIRVDGGMAVNNWLLQFLADITETKITRPIVTETTALGAAYLAALQLGLFSSIDDIKSNWKAESVFNPEMSGTNRQRLLEEWQKAVQRCLL